MASIENVRPRHRLRQPITATSRSRCGTIALSLVWIERFTTIITYEEQMRGWLAWIAQAKSLIAQIERYSMLKRMVSSYAKISLLDFDRSAADEFERLKNQRIRIGTMDLKIAAIALANNATLLSRNLKDFGKVPGLKVEDWAAEK